MTTITPNPQEAEGRKLLDYTPGTDFTLTSRVESNDGTNLVVTNEHCEKVGAESEGAGYEGEDEAASSEPALPPKGTPPKALLIVGGKPPAR